MASMHGLLLAIGCFPSSPPDVMAAWTLGPHTFGAALSLTAAQYSVSHRLYDQTARVQISALPPPSSDGGEVPSCPSSSLKWG